MEKFELTRNEKKILDILKKYGPLPTEKLREMCYLSKSSFYYSLKSLILKKRIEIVKQPIVIGKSFRLRSLVIPK